MNYYLFGFFFVVFLMVCFHLKLAKKEKEIRRFKQIKKESQIFVKLSESD